MNPPHGAPNTGFLKALAGVARAWAKLTAVRVRDELTDPMRARGRVLTRMGHVMGARRRWFGLEPDFMFRRRLATDWRRRNDRGHTWGR